MADLENSHVVMQSGYSPTLSDPRFHQQMVYAVAMYTYDNFRVALGRHVSWAFSRCRDDGNGERTRLLLRPHGAEEANVWYDRGAGEIIFGYFKAKRSTPVVQKGVGNVFTSVSHDVIAHEMSHTLLDGLRDYCPPVDVRFGDNLRALITADYDVVPDDKLGYREAIIRALGERGIFGAGTPAMTEDALLWHSPRNPIEPLNDLSFSSMQFDGDPAKPVSVAEMRRQVGVLGRLVSQPPYAREFGLVNPGTEQFKAGGYELPLLVQIYE